MNIIYNIAMSYLGGVFLWLKLAKGSKKSF